MALVVSLVACSSQMNNVDGESEKSSGHFSQPDIRDTVREINCLRPKSYYSFERGEQLYLLLKNDSTSLSKDALNEFVLELDEFRACASEGVVNELIAMNEDVGPVLFGVHDPEETFAYLDDHSEETKGLIDDIIGALKPEGDGGPNHQPLCREIIEFTTTCKATPRSLPPITPPAVEMHIYGGYYPFAYQRAGYTNASDYHRVNQRFGVFSAGPHRCDLSYCQVDQKGRYRAVVADDGNKLVVCGAWRNPGSSPSNATTKVDGRTYTTGCVSNYYRAKRDPNRYRADGTILP